MLITNPGDVTYMSAIIGVCGTNFCSFVADKRRVEDSVNGIKVVDDNFEKIFKINDRVMIGATGWFGSDETILAPLDVYPDKSVVTIRTALREILRYIEENKTQIHRDRNYLIGGKDNKGTFCIVEVHVDGESSSVTGMNRVPQPPEYNYAVSCALPASLAGKEDEYISKVGGCINASSTLDDMVVKVKGIIRGIANIDKSVGNHVVDYRVF